MNNITKLKLVVLLNYTAVGSIIGFVQGGIAPILRSHGTSLHSMTWVFTLYLPFGLAFLWSPVFDRLNKQYSYRQQAFVMGLVAMAILLIMAVTSLASPNWTVLWILALLLNVTIASLDLALDGLSSLACPAPLRPSIAAAKLAGLSLGLLIGGGILVGQFEHLNWSGVFSIILLILLVATALIHVLNDPPSDGVHRQGTGLSICWRDREFRSKLWRVALFSGCLMALFHLNRLLLVDVGLPLKKIGVYLGVLTPIGSLLIAIILPRIIRHYSHRRVLLWMSVLFIAVILGLIAMIGLNQITPMLILTIVIGWMCSAFLLVIGSIILDWAKSEQAATDYALLYGLGRVCATLSLMVLPALTAIIGWEMYYFVMMLLFTIAAKTLYTHLQQ